MQGAQGIPLATVFTSGLGAGLASYAPYQVEELGSGCLLSFILGSPDFLVS